jgi:hypothetical protein
MGVHGWRKEFLQWQTPERVDSMVELTEEKSRFFGPTPPEE